MNLDNIIKELRRLNRPVPKPFRLPTLSEIETTESKLGVNFHPDYRKYLLEASDVFLGTIEPATVAPGGGHTNLLEICDFAWNQVGVSKNLLPICEDNGSYFCMNTDGEIVYWDHNGTTGESWPNLATWVEAVWLNIE